MFWKFFIGLFIISLIFPFIYALLISPTLGLTLLLTKQNKEPEDIAKFSFLSLINYPIMAIIFLANVYVLSGWSAYVASSALVYSSMPEITHQWIYYVTGFFLCHAPLVFMASKESQKQQERGTFLHISIAMIMYILFSIWPSLMTLPYGWFLRWIYG